MFSFKKIISVCVCVSFIFSFVLKESLFAVSSDISGAAQNYISDIQLSSGKIVSSNITSSKNLVVNIQDIHFNSDIQRTISSVLSELDKKYGIEKIYLEGAYGKVDVSWLSSFIGKTNTAEALLKEGNLTGPEYFCASTGNGDKLFGLEDKTVYLENLQRLSEIYSFKDRLNVIVSEIESSINTNKDLYFTGRNIRLDRAAVRYRNNEISSKKYAAILKKSVVSLRKEDFAKNSSFKNLYYDNGIYLNASALLNTARDLNPKKLDSELQKALSVLKNELSYKDYSAIMNNFKSESDLPSLLSAVSAAGIAESGNYPEIKKYINYFSGLDKLDEAGMLNEEKRLVRELIVLQSGSFAEAEAGFLSEYVLCLRDFINNAITPEDYKYFTENFNLFNAILAKYCGNEALQSVLPEIDIINSFYESNLKRNEIFVKNITDGFLPVSASAENPGKKKVTVCVTGGFHSEGLEKILKEKGLSYIVVMPRINKYSDSEAVYATALSERMEYAKNMFNLPALSGLPAAAKSAEVLRITLSGLINEYSFDSVFSSRQEYADEILKAWNGHKDISGALGNIRSVQVESNSIIFDVNGNAVEIELKSEGAEHIKKDNRSTAEILMQTYKTLGSAEINISGNPGNENAQHIKFAAAAAMDKRLLKLKLSPQRDGESLLNYYDRLLFDTDVFSKLFISELTGMVRMSTGVDLGLTNAGGEFTVRELVRNAFVHGNKLDETKEIYLIVDYNVPSIRIMNEVSQEEADAEKMKIASDAGLHGNHEKEGADSALEMIARYGDFEYGTSELSNGQTVFAAEFKKQTKRSLSILFPLKNLFSGRIDKIIDRLSHPLSGAPLWETVLVGAAFGLFGFVGTAVFFAASHLIAAWAAKAIEIKRAESVSFAKALSVALKGSLTWENIKANISDMMFLVEGSLYVVAPFLITFLPLPVFASWLMAAFLSMVFHYNANSYALDHNKTPLSIAKHFQVNRFTIYNEDGTLYTDEFGANFVDIAANHFSPILETIKDPVIIKGGIIGKVGNVRMGYTLFKAPVLTGMNYELYHDGNEIVKVVIKNESGETAEIREVYKFTDDSGKPGRMWVIKEITDAGRQVYEDAGIYLNEITMETPAGETEKVFTIGVDSNYEFFMQYLKDSNQKMKLRGMNLDAIGKASFLSGPKKTFFQAKEMAGRDLEQVYDENGEIESVNILNESGDIVETRTVFKYEKDGSPAETWLITYLSEEAGEIYDTVRDVSVSGGNEDVYLQFSYLTANFPGEYFQYFAGMHDGKNLKISGLRLDANGSGEVNNISVYAGIDYAGMRVDYTYRNGTIVSFDILNEDGSLFRHIVREEKEETETESVSLRQQRAEGKTGARKNISFFDENGKEIVSQEGAEVSFENVKNDRSKFSARGAVSAKSGFLTFNWQTVIRQELAETAAEIFFENGKASAVVFYDESGNILSRHEAYFYEDSVEWHQTVFTQEGKKLLKEQQRSGRSRVASGLKEAEIFVEDGSSEKFYFNPNNFPKMYFGSLVKEHKNLRVEGLNINAGGRVLFNSEILFAAGVFSGKNVDYIFKDGDIAEVIIKDGKEILETRKAFYDEAGNRKWYISGITEAGKKVYEANGQENLEIIIENPESKEIVRFFHRKFDNVTDLYKYFIKNNPFMTVKGLKTTKKGVLEVAGVKIIKGEETLNENNVDIEFENGMVSHVTIYGAEGKERRKVSSFYKPDGTFSQYYIFKSKNTLVRTLKSFGNGTIKGVQLDPSGKFPFALAPHINGEPGGIVDVIVVDGIVRDLSGTANGIASAVGAFFPSQNPVADPILKTVSSGKSSVKLSIADDLIPAQVIDSLQKGGTEIVITGRDLYYDTVLESNTGRKILFMSARARFTAEIVLKVYNVDGVNVPVLNISNIKSVNGKDSKPASGYLNEAGNALIREIRDNRVLQKEISDKFNLNGKALFSAAASKTALNEAEMEMLSRKTTLSVSGVDIKEENALYLVSIMKSAGVGNIILRDMPFELSAEQVKALEIFNVNGINVHEGSFSGESVKITAGIIDASGFEDNIKPSNSFEIYFEKGVTVTRLIVDSAMNNIKEKFVLQADDYYLHGLLLDDYILPPASQAEVAKRVYDLMSMTINNRQFEEADLELFSGIFEKYSPELAKAILNKETAGEELLKAQQLLRGIIERLLVKRFYSNDRWLRGFSDRNEERLFGRLLFAQNIEETLKDMPGEEISGIMHRLMPETAGLNWTELSFDETGEFKNLLFNENTNESLSALLAIMQFSANDRVGGIIFDDTERAQISAIVSVLKAA